MSEQFSFLGDKYKAAIVATISLGVLLLLPASLGYGGTLIIQEAFGQEPPPSASTFLLRGLIGSILPAQAGDITTENGSSSHVVTGRFRVFANESLVNRFVAEMDLAAIDGTAINGTAFHNVTIEDTTPHRFQLAEIGNGSATTSAGGSVPPVTSNLMTRIYVDSNTPIVDNVPVTISITGQVLAIEGINIDETTITNTGQQDILSIIDGQSIYGIVAR